MAIESDFPETSWQYNMTQLLFFLLMLSLCSQAVVCSLQLHFPQIHFNLNIFTHYLYLDTIFFLFNLYSTSSFPFPSGALKMYLVQIQPPT